MTRQPSHCVNYVCGILKWTLWVQQHPAHYATDCALSWVRVACGAAVLRAVWKNLASFSPLVAPSVWQDVISTPGGSRKDGLVRHRPGTVSTTLNWFTNNTKMPVLHPDLFLKEAGKVVAMSHHQESSAVLYIASRFIRIFPLVSENIKRTGRWLYTADHLWTVFYSCLEDLCLKYFTCRWNKVQK